jgi:hypothetical protein
MAVRLAGDVDGGVVVAQFESSASCEPENSSALTEAS